MEAGGVDEGEARDGGSRFTTTAFHHHFLFIGMRLSPPLFCQGAPFTTAPFTTGTRGGETHRW